MRGIKMQGLGHLRGFIGITATSESDINKAPAHINNVISAPFPPVCSNITLQPHNDLRHTDGTFPEELKKATQIDRIISTIRKKITEDLNCNKTDFTKMLPVALPTLTLISNRKQALRPLDNQDLKVSNNEKLKELATALLNDYKEEIIEEAISEITKSDILQAKEAANNVNDTEWNNDQITNYKDLHKVILNHIRRDTKNVRAYTAFMDSQDSQDFKNLPNRSMTLIRSYVTSSCTLDLTSKIDGKINSHNNYEDDFNQRPDNVPTSDEETFPMMKLNRKRQ
jgi:hypothetical protein